MSTINATAEEYGLKLSEALTSPWEDGAIAIQDYSEKFGLSSSSTVNELNELKDKHNDLNTEIERLGNQYSNQVESNYDTYTKARKQTKPKKDKPKPTNNKSQEKTIKVGGKINDGSAKIYDYAGDTSGEHQYYSKDPIYVVLEEKSGYLKVRHKSLKSGITGWFKKSDVKAYAKGSTGVDEDQWALLHELGEELVLSAGKDGKLQYITRGTAVIPHDISEKLMELGQLDPQDILDRNRPSIAPSKSVVNNAVEINMSIAEVVHIDKATSDSVPDITKAVKKQMDSYMAQLNNAIKAKVR